MIMQCDINVTGIVNVFLVRPKKTTSQYISKWPFLQGKYQVSTPLQNHIICGSKASLKNAFAPKIMGEAFEIDV